MLKPVRSKLLQTFDEIYIPVYLFRYLPGVFLFPHWSNLLMLLTDCVDTPCPAVVQSAPLRVENRERYGENGESAAVSFYAFSSSPFSTATWRYASTACVLAFRNTPGVYRRKEGVERRGEKTAAVHKPGCKSCRKIAYCWADTNRLFLSTVDGPFSDTLKQLVKTERERVCGCQKIKQATRSSNDNGVQVLTKPSVMIY